MFIFYGPSRLQSSGPEVIKLFSCSTHLSMKFVMLIHLKLLTMANSFLLNIAEHENFWVCYFRFVYFYLFIYLLLCFVCVCVCAAACVRACVCVCSLLSKDRVLQNLFHSFLACLEHAAHNILKSFELAKIIFTLTSILIFNMLAVHALASLRTCTNHAVRCGISHR